MLTPGPHDIVFTQYLMPDGRRTTVFIERAPEIADIARRVIAAGYHFDTELLSDYRTVSMTCEPNVSNADGEDLPIAHELVANGPLVPEAVDRLVTTASTVLGLTVAK